MQVCKRTLAQPAFLPPPRVGSCGSPCPAPLSSGLWLPHSLPWHLTPARGPGALSPLPTPRRHARAAAGCLCGRSPHRTLPPSGHPLAVGQTDSKPSCTVLLALKVWSCELPWPWPHSPFHLVALMIQMYSLLLWRPESQHLSLWVQAKGWAGLAPPKVPGDTASPCLPSSGRLLLATRLTPPPPAPEAWHQLPHFLPHPGTRLPAPPTSVTLCVVC